MRPESKKIVKRIVFSEEYGVDIGAHVFPTAKYKLVYNKLISSGLAVADDFVEPELAKDEDVALVHTPEYMNKLKTGTLSHAEILTLELPYSKELVRVFWLYTGGTILASNIALDAGVGIHMGGGFHHAFADHGEGFCVLNDIAVAARTVQKHSQAEKVLIVDCDVHQGNGTASIFGRHKNVFTFSMHHVHNYPFYKPPGDMDINLPDDCGNDEYLGHLESKLPGIINKFSPDMIIYLAGADPYEQDQLGGLALTMEGLEKRDRYVLGLSKENQIPVVITFGGGYAFQLEDTVQIHFNTVKAALEIFYNGK